MFVLRSLFWLSTLVMLLPPAPDGRPAPRLSVIHAAYAVRVIAQDVTGVCERNPQACATSREALNLLSLKVGTGFGIVSAGIAAGGGPDFRVDPGTLHQDELALEWTAANVGR